MKKSMDYNDNSHTSCLLTYQGHGFLKVHPSVELVCRLVLKNIPALEVVALYPSETWEVVPLLDHPVHFLL